jgi:NAD(P)-dependent dehydrogenase (short-subunit alcohol dehydrogenase family)
MTEVAIVTGAGRGIGAAVAEGAAARGMAVCINYRANADAAERLVKRITGNGGLAIAVRGDVSVERDVMEMFRRVDGQLGPVTALVNNAGITGGECRVDAITPEVVQATFATNVTGTFLCCREAIRRMSRKHGGVGGAIVNLSSAAARLGGAGRTIHYAASKGAINTMTFGLAIELAEEGVRVNAVSPGVIDTEMQNPARFAAMVPTLPMKRAGSAEEVAAAVLWLLSPEASYVSGTVVDVSGAR